MHTAPSAKVPDGGRIVSHYVRWKFDPNATDPLVEPMELINFDGEMPKVDARYETKPYKHVFLAMHDPNSKEAPVGGSYNSIAKGNVEDGTFEYWSAGSATSLHEVAFVPRSDDGKFDSDQLLRAKTYTSQLHSLCKYKIPNGGLEPLTCDYVQPQKPTDMSSRSPTGETRCSPRS